MRARQVQAGRTLRLVRNVSASLAVLVAVAGLAAPSGAATPGSAGVDTALPPTDSQVTVSGRGPFSELRVTVNQTKDLGNQAVSVTWTGATPTKRGASTFAEHYLQIMQCWGDPDGTSPDNPGPPPEQCVQGATDSVYGGRNAGLFPAGGFALERVISRRDFPGFDPEVGTLDPVTGWSWRPFRAVDGTEVGIHYDPAFSPAVEGGQYWLNPYFNSITTNEVAGGRTRSNGSGQELFEVNTGLESSGLGCGQRVQPVAGGAPKVPRCWLVVVPRGDAATENEGTLRDASFGVATSPLSPSAWQHRIAIPLEFNPVDSACDIAEEPRRIVGSELPQVAVSSWQRVLCSVEGLPPYAYGTVGDASARQQLAAGGSNGTGMAVVSRPLAPATVDGANPVVYAPLTASALAIGFNIERSPTLDAPEAERSLQGVRVAELNLTPRLVAKLLTQSYASQTAIRAPSPYEWALSNPAHLVQDPDFLRFNAEFELLEGRNAKNLGGLVLPSRPTDATRQVWEWIFADPEAAAWMRGAPDEWGMQVNPVYAATAEANPAGVAFGEPVPEVFPKSDPHCYQAPAQGPGGSVVPPLLCGTDWLPYAQGLQEAARLTRAADDGARTIPDPFAAAASGVYRRDGPQVLGSRTILSLVDTASAHRYGVQTARLSRAGDDGADRRFLAPDEAGITAAVDAMEPGPVAQVLQADPRADAPDAYPLATLTYAATMPLSLDQQARLELAAFLSYAVEEGQVTGNRLGQLPPGYAPLPAALRAQAAEAIRAIVELQAAAPAGGPSGAGDGAGSAPGAGRGAGSLARSGAGGSSAAPVAPATSLPGESEPETRALGAMTPILALAGNRFVLPILAAVALASALGAVELTRRPGTFAPATDAPLEEQT